MRSDETGRVPWFSGFLWNCDMNTIDLHPARVLAYMPLQKVQGVQNQIWAADMIMPIPEEPEKQSAAGRQGVASVQ